MKKNDIKLDFERYKISGLEEAILAKNKSISQLEEIIEIAIYEKKNLLFTKLSLKKFQKLTPLISSKFPHYSHINRVPQRTNPKNTQKDSGYRKWWT